MDKKTLVDALSKDLKKQAASITYIKSADDKMFARQFGELKHSFPKNPFKGDVTIRCIQSGYVLGTRYDSSVEGAAVRSGAAATKKDVNFTSGGSWHKPYNDFFETDKRTESNYYLKVQCSDAQNKALCSDKFLWFVGGKFVGSEDDARKYSDERGCLGDYMKPVKPKNYLTSTQAAAGVQQGNEQHYFVVDIENLISIEQGSFVWTK